MSYLTCIGDNVVDIFSDRGQAFPGGNALNVAVYSQIFWGRKSKFIGIVGTDRFGDHIVDTLTRVSVGTNSVRRVVGPSGQAWVTVAEDGDRVFVASNGGGVQRGLKLRLNDTDMATIIGGSAVHTSLYSNLDEVIPLLSEYVPISYDFSQTVDLERIEPLAAHLDVAFFSGAGLSDEHCRTLAKTVVDAGANVAVVTAGTRGAWAATSHAVRYEGIVETDVRDTLGAGDAFIAGFLAARSCGGELERCLQQAAQSGARACTMLGAFGYPLSVS